PPTTPEISTLSLHDALPICLRWSATARRTAMASMPRHRSSTKLSTTRRAINSSPEPTCYLPLRGGGEDTLYLTQCKRPNILTRIDRKSTRLNSSHDQISYAV